MQRRKTEWDLRADLVLERAEKKTAMLVLLDGEAEGR